MNIMLMSVTERTREIGIRMAIGARKRDIISQFLIESAVVSCFGGVIGIVLGCFLSAILGNLLLSQIEASYLPTIEQFTVLPSFGLIIGAFLFSALLGIIFGLYPANKASNLQPVGRAAYPVRKGRDYEKTIRQYMSGAAFHICTGVCCLFGYFEQQPVADRCSSGRARHHAGRGKQQI